MNEILVAKIYPDAPLPERNNPTDAGLDLHSYFDYILKPNEVRIIQTGCAILIPRGYVGLIFPKSRSDFLVGAGVIDAGYTGEIKVKIVNTTGHTLGIAYDDAFAQMVIVPVETPAVKEVNYPHLTNEGERLSARGQEGGINRG